ncbi:bifunctional glutamate N-acetyltransferase/amino-acid acetyltransferase ArgJ [Psychrobacter sp. DAB_AL62B]|uniref:bifunctional glutamate N-acetyltransferase/amino-acid acetyltransferase ArgJ n=1 Tax=Psychrobacter sp. DAB_AL62B TaxID=1028420 RepID=UPI002380D58B|nr:bifunctional glutamate N-acetyltransferase/amino-acid acetyltransferase ArgJ [Psychrobacter sp. DAB_AL62B]MDE4453855.1 bifunctional glutamate N-acetyltransferase/amino-acid acetyltransferase ArgJ [Psychrobacter sp. DAB_AL62B]
MAVGNIAVPETIYPINGIKLSATAAGVRYRDRDDLVIIEIAADSTAAIVTTKNAFCAAPVRVLREHFAKAAPRYLVTNTGNANAGTGADGKRRATDICAALAAKAGVDTYAVLPFSTGVIGEPLNSDAIIAGLDNALANLAPNNWLAAANGIRTTDTIPKLASKKIDIAGSSYHITGMSKGSGMIRPNMATMLGYVATDANIAADLLQEMLSTINEQSFNRITVDGDTSTNDCCVLIATGAASSDMIDSPQHPHYQSIFEALTEVFVRLAQLIVRDGEGATKFMTVKVTGGKTTQECCDVAYAVAHSPLVKTAFFASDANWGRILAAVGYAGIEDLDTEQVDVYLDEVMICQNGEVAPSYTEQAGKSVMNRPEITIHINLARGDASDTVYTCDLSYDYVKINADYRS